MEQPPGGKAGRRLWCFAAGLAGSLILLNAVLIGAAREDRSFVAGWLAFPIGPLLNAALAAASCLLIPDLQRTTPGYSSETHVSIAMLLSMLGALVCFAAIMSLDLHGC